MRAHAAVDQEGLAGHKIAFGRGQKNHRTNQVFRQFLTLDHAVGKLHGGTAAVDRSDDLGGAQFTIRWRARH